VRRTSHSRDTLTRRTRPAGAPISRTVDDGRDTARHRRGRPGCARTSSLGHHGSWVELR
jgi:hypothetical protein